MPCGAVSYCQTIVRRRPVSRRRPALGARPAQLVVAPGDRLEHADALGEQVAVRVVREVARADVGIGDARAATESVVADGARVAVMVGDARELIADVVLVARDVGVRAVHFLDAHDAAERVVLLAHDVAVRVDPLEQAAVVVPGVHAPFARQRRGDHAVEHVVVVERRRAGCTEAGLRRRDEPAHGVVDEAHVLDRLPAGSRVLARHARDRDRRSAWWRHASTVADDLRDSIVATASGVST